MWEYIISQLKKMTEVATVYAILIFVTWITLYNLTDAATVTNYFWIGVGVCVLNALIYNLSKLKIKSVFIKVTGSLWQVWCWCCIMQDLVPLLFVLLPQSSHHHSFVPQFMKVLSD